MTTFRIHFKNLDTDDVGCEDFEATTPKEAGQKFYVANRGTPLRITKTKVVRDAN